MAKSKGRLLAELLASDGKVKESKSALDISGGKLAPSDIPILPNSKLENSSITIAGESTALGGSVSLNTGHVTEHTNFKYYTDARANTRVAAATGANLSLGNKDTDDLSEGSSNLYFTNSRADARITNALVDEDNMASNSASKLPSQQSVKAYVDSQVASKDALSELSGNTGDISEGSNLYFTNTRADARVNAVLPNTGSLSEGSNLYYTNARADARIAAADTGDLSEGSNLYHTTARARTSISATGSLSYNSSSGVMSFTMPAQNTGAITEGSNLYYTDARVQTYIGGNRSYGDIATTGVTAGNNSTSAIVRAHYSDGSYMTLEGYGLVMNRSASYIRPTTDNDKTLYIGGADATLDWNGIYFRSGNGLYMTGTKFLDSSRNLTVATGAVSGKFAVMSSSVHGSFDFYNNGTTYLNGTVTLDADTNISSGVLKVGGTTVIDASRNLTNIGTINSGAITSTGASQLFVGSDAVTVDNSGLTLTLTGTYSDGRYEHRFRKKDEGGGIPLYVDTTESTANSHTQIARFGSYSGNTDQFEVYGTMSSDGYRINNTTVIDANRNLTNVGIITATQLNMLDNQQLRLGNSQDLKIKHDGSNSFIQNTTGNLFIENSITKIMNRAGNETIASFNQDGAVELYHNNVKKIETTAAGATVTGTITGDITGSLSGTATQSSNLTNHNTGGLTEGSNLYYTDSRVGTYLSNNGYATQSTIVAAITDSAPGTLNTLNELAAALGDDASFSTTVTDSIATKLPLAGGTITGNLTVNNNLYIGDGNDGYFYNDINGRTAFRSGDFYIQDTVTNFYNYATNQYYGDSSGDNIHFRGNVLNGTNWIINPSDMRTRRYYSSDNTAYYTDPSETSVIKQILINGANNNSGKADFAVGAGGDPQVSWVSNQVQIGSTDMNYNGKVFYDSNVFSMAAWDGNIDFFSVGGSTSRNIIFRPSNAGTSTERLTIHGDNGAVVASSQMRAPIFYDSDNTVYYTNPAGASKMSSIQLGGGTVPSITGSGTYLRVSTSSGRVDIGAGNTSYLHIMTDRPQFYFDKKIVVDEGIVRSYDEDLQLDRAGSTTARIRITNGITHTDQPLTVAGNVQHTGLTMTSGTDIDQIYSVTDSLTLSTSWQNTSINSSELQTGTYIVQVYVSDFAVGGGHYYEMYSGIMSWYGSSTNSTGVDELPLHRAGHAANAGDFYMRTARHASGGNNLTVQVRGTTSNSGASNYIFKFRRMI